MWASYGSGAWLWPLAAAIVVAAAAVIAVALARLRRPGPDRGAAARQILAQRLALGDIGEREYRERLATVNASTPGRQPASWRRATQVAVIATAVAVAVASVAVAAVVTRPSPAGSGRSAGPGCSPGRLPGHVVGVTLWDMMGMMGGGRYSGARPAGQHGGMRMMRLTATPASVPAGKISFRASNAGSLTHELVILPLPAGGAGSRPIGPGGTVSEHGSLGEASASCAAGKGGGIRAGATGWVTLRLVPGRYELICNLPGHYAMGMYTDFDVR